MNPNGKFVFLLPHLERGETKIFKNRYNLYIKDIGKLQWVDRILKFLGTSASNIS